jgi:protein required for attachment to host cells
MTKTWVLVADASRARIFSLESHQDSLHEIATLTHPESRLHEHELTTDRPGRTFDSSGQGGRHAMEQKSSPKRQEALSFARSIGARLESARIAGDFGHLVLVAGPPFLGLLREQLSDEIRKHVTLEIDKELTTLDAAELRSRLPQRL